MSYKYIIASGWWCTDEDNRSDKFLNGDDAIRGSDFHNVWSSFISKYSKPQQVVIVDSNSPIKPRWNSDLLDITVLELSSNLGHASSLNGEQRYCGWSASVLLSMQYVMLSNADFYVYVEQDALIIGEGIIDNLIQSMGNSVNFLFGKSSSSVQPLQQSFFIVRKNHLNRFVCNYLSIPYSDKEICPEVKFAISTSYFSRFIPKFLFKQYPNSSYGKVLRRLVVYLSKFIGSYKSMNIGYGRDRPIDFNSKCLYFQHGSLSEIKNANERFIN